MDLVEQFHAYGIHVLGIKDMAGLLKPRAAKILIGAIREKYPDLPIHVHTVSTVLDFSLIMIIISSLA
jgi:pyruvate carboxylase